MGQGPRLLAILAALACAVVAAFAATHDHERGSEDGIACSVCLVANQADEAAPPAPMPEAAPLPVARTRARAFALILAVRPPLTVVPPGRAPPLAG